MTAAQLTRLAVLGSLVSSLSAALSMRTADSDPAMMLSAAAKNAAFVLSMRSEES